MSLDRQTPPVIHQATNFTYDLPPCETHTIGDNLKLYTVNAGTQPVSSFQIYIPRDVNDTNDVVIAKSVSALIKSGTTTKTALQINEEIEQVGATMSCTQNNDYIIIKLQCLSKHFQNLLPLLFEIINDAQYPNDELEIYRQQAIQHMTINLKKSDFVANRTIDELIYGFNHPYGSYGVLEDYEKLTREDLLSYHKDNVILNGASFFLSGKFDIEVVDALKKQLGQITQSTKSVVEPTLIEKPHTDKKHRLINDEEALQGAIRIANKFITRDHPDYIPMQFVNTLFGGYFGSRLMSNIREDKGYTYGIYSFIQQNKYSNSYIIATDVGKDVAEKAVAEVWNEMTRLKSELVSKEELQLVKNYILGSLLGSLDGPFKIMNRWRSLILNGKDKSQFDSSIQTFKNITAADVQTLANRYYVQDNFYDLIVY